MVVELTDFRESWNAHSARYPQDIVLWAEEQWLVRSTSSLIKLEPHQRYILRLAFTRDSAGRFPFQTVVWSEPKKSGKTEIGGLVALWLTLTEPGIPETYILANDLEQAQSRAFAAARQVVRKNDVLRRELRLHPKRITFPDDAFIQAVPNDYAGEAGANQALTVWDELWAYTRENSIRLWDEFTPVPTRLNSLRLVTTYAGFRNESKLLWDIYSRVVRHGERIHPEYELYTDRRRRTLVFWSHTPRMPWQTQEYYEDQRAELRPAAFRRLHLNQWVKATSAFIDGSQWDALVHSYKPDVWAGQRHTPVYVGVDAAHKRDCTAVVAIGYSLETGPFLVDYRIWRPRPGVMVLPEETAVPFILDLHKRFRVMCVAYDPAHFLSAATMLARKGVPMEEYAQTGDNLLRMGQALWDSIRSAELIVYNAPDLREHVLNATVKESARGWKLTRDNAERKIDGAVALGQALTKALERGKIDARRAALPEFV